MELKMPIDKSNRGNPNWKKASNSNFSGAPTGPEEVEHIIAPFSLYEEEATVLRKLGGLLQTRVEEAIRLYLKSSHQLFSADMLCHGPRQTFYVRLRKDLYDRFMATWTRDDPLAEAVVAYIARKRRAA
jgi:hypothetical protein